MAPEPANPLATQRLPPLAQVGPERWLVAFLYADLAATEGQLLDAQKDALVFTAPEPGQVVTEGYGRLVATRAKSRRRGDFERKERIVEDPDAESAAEWFPKTTLLGLQYKLQQAVAGLRIGREWQATSSNWQPGGITLVLRDGRLRRKYHIGRAADLFALRAGDVLVSVWPSIRFCERPGCHRVFLAARKKRFCEVQCQRVVGWETYKATHPEGRGRDYHAEYRGRQPRAQRRRKRKS